MAEPPPRGVTKLILAYGALRTTLLALIFGGLGLIAGVILGVELGALDTHMDFCADDTAPNFITDPAARSAACR